MYNHDELKYSGKVVFGSVCTTFVSEWVYFESLFENYSWTIFYFFNTFQKSWYKCLCIRFLCLCVHALTLLNILQMSWNWYMLFISDTAWTVLKMVCIRLMVCLKRHTKVFRYITVYGGKILKAYFNMFILQ